MLARSSSQPWTRRAGRIAVLGAIGLGLVACSAFRGDSDRAGGPSVLASAYEARKAQAEAERAARDRARTRLSNSGLGDEASAGGQFGQVVYFEFDSDVVRQDDLPLLQAHARALMQNEARALRVEGHTDERGGSEYNLALGQRRAESVAQSLQQLGVPASRIEAVSYGKERPAVAGTDEAAWARNRRAELKDR